MITRIHELARFYHDSYRHPSLPKLAVSDPYDLFPTDDTSEQQNRSQWPADWPNVNEPGVYLIFDDHMQLLYIGKDALLGRRLGTYFQYEKGPSRRCRTVDQHAWPQAPAGPRFVTTIAVEKTFEAPSLEEFLILELKPPLNKIWVGESGFRPAP